MFIGNWPRRRCVNARLRIRMFAATPVAAIIAVMTGCPAIAQEHELSAGSLSIPIAAQSDHTDGPEKVTGTIIDGRSLLTLKGHTDWVSGVAFSPDGKQLVSVAWDETVRLWNTETGHQTLMQSLMRGPLSSVAIAPDGSRVAIVGFDYSVTILDAKSLALQTTLDGRIGEPVTFSGDGKQVTAINATKQPLQGVVAVWDTTNGRKLRVLKDQNNPDELCYRLVCSSDRSRHAVMIVNATEESLRIEIMESQTDSNESKELVSFEGKWMPLAFSPDGQWIAALTAENITLLPMKHGQPTRTIAAPPGTVTSADFSPDGKWLATVSPDTTIRIWKVADGTEALTLKGHKHSVSCVVFSPDGRRLATSSFDNTIQIWELQFAP